MSQISFEWNGFNEPGYTILTWGDIAPEGSQTARVETQCDACKYPIMPGQRAMSLGHRRVSHTVCPSTRERRAVRQRLLEV